MDSLKRIKFAVGVNYCSLSKQLRLTLYSKILIVGFQAIISTV